MICSLGAVVMLGRHATRGGQPTAMRTVSVSGSLLGAWRSCPWSTPDHRCGPGCSGFRASPCFGWAFSAGRWGCPLWLGSGNDAVRIA